MSRTALLAAVLVLVGVSSASFASTGVSLYFGDASGNAITSVTADTGSILTVYIYGTTATGNTYDYFNLGLAYDSAALTPTADYLTMSTSTTFGAVFAGPSLVDYNGTSLLYAAATSMGSAPDGFGPTLLATAKFTVVGTPTGVSFFNEAGEYNYSTFYFSTSDSSEIRFTDALDIEPASDPNIPEPATMALLATGLLGLIRRRRAA